MSRFPAHAQLDTHKSKHTTSKTLLNERPARGKGRYGIQQTKGTHIHAISGIRPRDTSNRVTADPRLRMYCLRDRLQNYLLAVQWELCVWMSKCSVTDKHWQYKVRRYTVTYPHYKDFLILIYMNFSKQTTSSSTAHVRGLEL